MFRMSGSIAATALCAILLQGARAARADDDRRGCGGKADIESLRAEAVPAGNEWVINVRYKVEVEHARPDDRYVLGLQLEDRGAVVADAGGQVRTLLVPLTEPTECDDEEVEFEAWVELTRFSDGAFCLSDLRVCAFVQHEGQSYQHDRERTDVKYPVVEIVAPVVEVIEPAPLIVRREVYVTRPAVVVRNAGPRVIVHERRPVHSVRVVRAVRMSRPS